MKIRLIAQESRANFASRASKPILGALTLFPIMLVLLVCKLWVLTSHEHASAEYRDTGAATFVISGASQINGAACDRLAALPGVLASGAFKATPLAVTLTKLPNAPVTVFQATSGFHQLLTDTSNPTFGLLASVEIAEQLGQKTTAFPLDTAEQQQKLNVTGTFTAPDTSFATGMGWGLVQQVAPNTEFDQCWATAWPPTDAHQTIMHQAESLSQPDSSLNNPSQPAPRPHVQQLNTKLGAEYLIADNLDQHPTRFVTFLAALTGAAASFALIRLRALEFAALLHDGWQHREVTILAVIDNARWSVTTLSLAFSSAAVIALNTSRTEDLVYNLAALGAITLSAFCGNALGSIAGVATVREKHLFSLFKGR